MQRLLVLAATCALGHALAPQNKPPNGKRPIARLPAYESLEPKPAPDGMCCEEHKQPVPAGA